MNNEPISSGIRRIIALKGYKQKHIAEKAGFNQKQFSYMLTNQRIIKAVDMYPIAAALGVSVQEIFEAGQSEN